MGCVGKFGDILFRDWYIKTWPAGARFEFLGGVEQRRAAAHAMEQTCAIGEVVMGERALGSVFARDLEGQIRLLRAPFLICSGDLFHRPVCLSVKHFTQHVWYHN